MDLAQLIQVDETAVDKPALIQQLRRNLARRQLDETTTFPEFALNELAYTPEARLPTEVYERLAHLNQAYDQLWIEPDNSASSGWLGRWKRPLHQLAAYYANKLGERQTAVNDELRRLLHVLVTELEKPDPRVAELEAEVAALQARLQALEQRMHE